jgi:integrase
MRTREVSLATRQHRRRLSFRAGKVEAAGVDPAQHSNRVIAQRRLAAYASSESRYRSLSSPASQLAVNAFRVVVHVAKEVIVARTPSSSMRLIHRFQTQAVHRWWYRQLQAAGLVGRDVTHGLNMHLARHTFATELRRVAGIDAASQALGHADLNRAEK